MRPRARARRAERTAKREPIWDMEETRSTAYRIDNRGTTRARGEETRAGSIELIQKETKEKS